MKTIYKNEDGKERILELYDSQLKRLPVPYKDVFVPTSFGYDYGKWAGEVIDALGFDKINLFGGSFGAGIAAKTMCVVPQKIKKSVLYVPSGIKNAPGIKSANMLFPMILYWITKKDKWLRKCMMPMAITENNITRDIYQTSKLKFVEIVRVHCLGAIKATVSKQKLPKDNRE